LSCSVAGRRGWGAVVDGQLKPLQGRLQRFGTALKRFDDTGNLFERLSHGDLWNADAIATPDHGVRPIPMWS